MKSIIGEFYEWESSDVDWIDKGERYDEITNEISGVVEVLKKNLTNEQKQEIERVCLLFHRMEDEVEKTGYKAGFKSGLAVAMEALTVKEC